MRESRLSEALWAFTFEVVKAFLNFAIASGGLEVEAFTL
jgi:hypothetical protein